MSNFCIKEKIVKGPLKIKIKSKEKLISEFGVNYSETYPIIVMEMMHNLGNTFNVEDDIVIRDVCYNNNIYSVFYFKEFSWNIKWVEFISNLTNYILITDEDIKL